MRKPRCNVDIKRAHKTERGPEWLNRAALHWLTRRCWFHPTGKHSPTVPTTRSIAIPLPHRRLQHMSLPSCAPGGKDMRIMDERKHAAAAEYTGACWLSCSTRPGPTGDIMHAYTPWKHPDTLELIPSASRLRQGDWRPGAAPPGQRGRLSTG